MGGRLKAAIGLGLVGFGMATGSSAAAPKPVVEISQTVKTQADLTISEIAPQLTHPEIRQARGPNIAVVDDSVAANGFLLLSLGGTNSYPRDFLAFDKVAAGEGFAALGLDYNNTVITTSCKTSVQPDPCTLFREEIGTGAQVSDLVEVDEANSIEHRLENLLRYQAQHDPARYADFVNEEGPVWEKIVVVGHSQGAGHAGYLAKKYPLQAAILLAGPQDTTDEGPASWLSAPSATDPERYFSFLHQNDFFDSQAQLGAVRLLREEPEAVGSLVAHQSVDSPIIISQAQVRDGHMSVIGPEFTEIWQGLLRRSVR